MKKIDRLKLFSMAGEYCDKTAYFAFLMTNKDEEVEKLKTIIEPYGYHIVEESYAPELGDWEVITDIPYDILCE